MLTDPQSWNAYTYARNRPLFFVDLDGRQNGEPVYTCDCTYHLFGDGDIADFSWARQAARAAQQLSDQAESLAGLIASSEAFWSFLDVALDSTPAIGTIKSGVELATGYNYITNETVDRRAALAGIALGAVGAGAARGATKLFAKKAIVIGENMARVRKAAGIDIGPDFARRADRAAQGVRPASPFYNMERMETKGSANYVKLFDRNGKLNGF